jgi:hypothetical protein
MAINFFFMDAAQKYGLKTISDPYVMGAFTAAYQSWAQGSDPPRLHDSALKFVTANGFEWGARVEFTDATHGTLHSLDVINGNDIIWYANGYAPFDLDHIDLKTIFGGDDNFLGNSFDNWFLADAGNDTIDGSKGTDSVFYANVSSAFGVTRGASNLVVANASFGTDTLTNVERLLFTDHAVAFDTAGAAGQAYRLYQAALDRAPDAGGLGYYIDKLDRGIGEHDIATGFINSPEFLSRFGANLTDLQYVQQLYQNVLHRAGEDAGVSYQLDALQGGTVDRAQLLVNFSESPENQANLIGVMQQGMVYLAQAG